MNNKNLNLTSSYPLTPSISGGHPHGHSPGSVGKQSCLGLSKALPPLCCFQSLLGNICLPLAFYLLRSQKCIPVRFRGDKLESQISGSSSLQNRGFPLTLTCGSVKLIPGGCLVPWAVFFQVVLLLSVTCSGGPANELPTHSQTSPISYWGLLCLS